MKRSLWCAIVAAHLLVASGVGYGAQAKSTTLKMLYWAEPKVEKGAWEAVVKEFERQNPSIKVDMTMIPVGQYYDKLRAMVAAGTAPDVMRHAQQSFEQYADMGTMLDLTPYIRRDWKSEGYSNIYDKLIDMWRYQGGLYGVPFDYNVVIPLLNKNLLRSAGLPFPDSKWSWSDYLTYAKKMTKDLDGNGTSDQFGTQIETGFVFLETWCRAWGGKLIADDGGSMALELPATVHALEEAQAYVQQYKVAPVTAGAGGKAFDKGKVGMVLSGHWWVTYLSTLKEGICDWEFAHMPYAENGRRATVFGAGMFGVSSKTKEPEAAWQLASFFAGREAQETIADVGISMPVRTSMAKKVIVGTKEFNQQVFKDAFEQYAMPFPAPPKYYEVEAAAWTTFEAVWKNKKSVKQAVADLTEALNKKLARAK